MDDTERSTVLYATARVLELCLANNIAARLLRPFVEANLVVAGVRSAILTCASSLTRGVLPTAPTKPSTARVVNPRARVFASTDGDMVVEAMV